MFRSSLFRELIERRAAERSNFDHEHRLQMADGSVKFVRVMAHPSNSGESDELVFIGAITDITGRKLSYEALRESEERFRSMADTLPEGIWIGTIDPRQVQNGGPS